MYWLLIGLGFPLLTLFTVRLDSVLPLEWTIIQKLSLGFAYFSIVLFWGVWSSFYCEQPR